MAIDKLRAVTPRRPGRAWFDLMNAEWHKPKEERRYTFSFIYRDQKEVASIGLFSQVRISTKPNISPHYMVELNFMAPGGKLPPMTVFETNPNKYDKGWEGVVRQVDEIFTDDCPDLKLTRLDFNAEVEVATSYLKDTLRVPAKRKSGNVWKERQDWQNRGTETFYIGRRPSQLRVYDKVQEMKYRRKDVSFLPQNLTRIEFELHNDRCPIDQFSEIPALLPDCHPFAGIQIHDSSPLYDFRNDVIGSFKRFSYNELVKREGKHEAHRIVNAQRNFSRDYAPYMVDNVALKAAIEVSFARNAKRLLSGKGADVEHIYHWCAWCNCPLPMEDIRNCHGCGVRLCFVCMELDRGHFEPCPIGDLN